MSGVLGPLIVPTLVITEVVYFLGDRLGFVAEKREVVPGLVELEVAVPRLRPAVCVVGVGRSTKNTNREGPP